MEQAPFHQLEGDALPPARAFWARTEDDIRLRLAAWGVVGAPQGTVLLFPGRSEYIEKYATVAQELVAQGWAVLAVDWRGQGLSDRMTPGSRVGHVGDFADYQRDVVEMVVAATELDLPRPWHLLAHSMGGCIGLAALLNDLPVTSAAFSSPMWGIHLGQFPVRVALGLATTAGRLGRGGTSAFGTGRATGTYVLDHGFSTNLLTSDAGEWARFVREAAAWPQLTLAGASFDWVAAALKECARLAALPSPDLPALIAVGGRERIVRPAAILDRAHRWPDAQLLQIPDARHELMMEAPAIRDTFLTAALDLFAAAR